MSRPPGPTVASGRDAGPYWSFQDLSRLKLA
jgi:hypothetical protein